MDCELLLVLFYKLETEEIWGRSENEVLIKFW